MELNFLNPETLEVLKTGGYFAMFAAMVAEWPFVTMAAAFLASLGLFDIFIVSILGWLGDIIGDFLFFCIGKYGLNIFSKKTQIDTKAEKNFIKKLDGMIKNNLLFALLIIKIIPYAPLIGLPYIGKMEISTKKYLFFTILACIPIPLISAIFGFNIIFFKNILQNSNAFEICIFLIIFAFFIFLIFKILMLIKCKISEKMWNISDFIAEKKNKK